MRHESADHNQSLTSSMLLIYCWCYATWAGLSCLLVSFLIKVCRLLTSSCFLRLASASFLASSLVSSLMSRICLCRRLFCSFSRFSLLLRWSRSSVSFSRFSLRRATRLCAVTERRFNNVYYCCVKKSSLFSFEWGQSGGSSKELTGLNQKVDPDSTSARQQLDITSWEAEVANQNMCWHRVVVD